MKALSLRARLTIWYTLALLLVLSLFAVQVLWQQKRIGLRRVDRELADLAATLTSVMRDEVREGAPTPAQEAIDTIGARAHAIAILDTTGRTLAASWNGLALPSPFGGVGTTDRASTVATASGAWRVFVHLEAIAGSSYVLLAGTPYTNVEREQHESVEAMAVGIPIAALLAALGGLWLASVGLRPITAMAARASQIVPGSVDDLGESDRGDELGQLARAFNGLLARLRATLQSQRQFMTDASHELRTPVSVIRSAADVTLNREHRDEPEYREALSIVGEQGRRVTRLVDDMLVLARADTGAYPIQRGHLYIDEVVTDCARTVALLARERGVIVCTPPPADLAIDGDEDLLRRMLLNVVQNAVLHTPPGQRVTIAVAPNGSQLGLEVTNEGPAIPAADRERIFDRFVQLDPARRANGSGLGLPIARWIAEAHGGTLTLKASGPQGTTFTIALPRSR
jgi:two-component system OmpR family sensor kinase